MQDYPEKQAIKEQFLATYGQRETSSDAVLMLFIIFLHIAQYMGSSSQ